MLNYNIFPQEAPFHFKLSTKNAYYAKNQPFLQEDQQEIF